MPESKDLRILNHLVLAEAISSDFYLKRSVSVTKDETVSEANIALLKAHETFDPKHNVPFGAYAKTVIKNHLRDFFSRLKHGQNLIALVGEITPKDESEEDFFTSRIKAEEIDPSQETYRNEVRKALAEGLSKLGNNQKQVMELIAQGHSYSEIAEKLEISKQAARQAAQRAIIHLREDLGEKGIGVLFQIDPEHKTEEEYDLPDVLENKDLNFSPYILSILMVVNEEKSVFNRYSLISEKIQIPAQEIRDTVNLAVKQSKMQGHLHFSDKAFIQRQLELEQRQNEIKNALEESKKRSLILIFGILLVVFIFILFFRK